MPGWMCGSAPSVGWQSIDVTHQRPAICALYCRLAVGRDYFDAAPVRGVRHGGGGEKHGGERAGGGVGPTAAATVM